MGTKRPENTIVNIMMITAVLSLYVFSYVHASGVYVKSWGQTTNTFASAANDVRLNIKTPPGHYSGYGECVVTIGNKGWPLTGTLWVTVLSSGWDGKYSVGEQYIIQYSREEPKNSYSWGYIN